MTTELRYLAWSIVLGLVHAIATGQFTTAQKGVRYAMSARDEQQKLEGVGARVERAFANYMQTFPFFAASVLAAHAAGRHSGLTASGAPWRSWAEWPALPCCYGRWPRPASYPSRFPVLTGKASYFLALGSSAGLTYCRPNGPVPETWITACWSVVHSECGIPCGR